MNIKGCKTIDLIRWVDEFENIHPTSYQENNKDLYHEVIETLFYRDWTNRNISLRHEYFININPNGNYIDYINWRKGDSDED